MVDRMYKYTELTGLTEIQMRCDVELSQDGVAMLLNEVGAFVGTYMENFGRAPGLRLLNRRYGTMAKRLSGRSLRELMVEQPNRFIIGFNEKGQTLVTAL